jgi:hypothetical protein
LGLGNRSIIDKAKKLEAMELDRILELKFKGDKNRSGSICNWFDGRGHNIQKSGVVRRQLQEYVASPTVQEEVGDKNFRAFAAVIVGSRQILVREMDKNGEWITEFQLCQQADLDFHCSS